MIYLIQVAGSPPELDRRGWVYMVDHTEYEALFIAILIPSHHPQ